MANLIEMSLNKELGSLTLDSAHEKFNVRTRTWSHLFFQPYQSVNATTIIVLHPGSTTLWLGRATDHAPQSMPHVIAWKRPAFCMAPKKSQSLIFRPGLHVCVSSKFHSTHYDVHLGVVDGFCWCYSD